jgi:hypothetical protein
MKSTSSINAQYTLIVLKNKNILDSIKDFFYQDLFHEIENIIHTDIDNIDTALLKVNTRYVIVVQEGCFFYDHLVCNFIKPLDLDLEKYSLIGHILNRKQTYYNLHEQCFALNIEHWKKAGKPKFHDNTKTNLTSIIRSPNNFHDDYTPTWIKKDSQNNIHQEDVLKIKFGGFVISELLKNNFLIRPFNKQERTSKKFIYYTEQEQIANLIEWKNLNHNHKLYFPYTTKPSTIEFDQKASQYISVAVAPESLLRINKVYKNINKIKYYDISITALIFTELFIKRFENHYINFVEDFQALIPEKHHKFKPAGYNLEYEKIKPVLDHIRSNNVETKYLIGDITRNSVLEDLNKDTIINFTNVFTYQKNLIRKEERNSYLKKLNNNVKIKQILM